MGVHPQTLEIRIGETDYTFSALRLRDWEDFGTACQFQSYNRVKGMGATQSQLDMAFRHCVEHVPTQDEISGYAVSIPGMREIVYLSARRHHPKLTRNEVSDLFCLGDETLKTVSEWISKVSVPEPPKEANSGNVEPAASGGA